MLDVLTGILSSSGLGAIIGSFGSWLTKREDRKIRELDHAHEKDMAELGLRESAQEQEHALELADKQIEQLREEGEIATDLGELKAFTASLKGGAKMTGIAIVDGVRGLMRPLITTYLLCLSTYLAYMVSSEVGGIDALSQKELFQLYREIILQLIFLTATAVTWWFGSRPNKKH